MQMRKRRGDLSNRDKHQDAAGDGYDILMSSRDDHSKDGKKCGEREDDKYREEIVSWNKHQYGKHRDKQSAKDHTRNRSDHKHVKEEKDNADSQLKRGKHVESDHNHGHNHNLNCDRDQDIESSDDHKQHREHVHAHDQGCYRENRVRKRNSEEIDDCNNTRFHVPKIHCSTARRSRNFSDSDAGRGGSQQPHGHDDSIGTSCTQRNVNSEDMDFKESITDMELRTKGPGYESPGKSTKIDYDFSNERSSSSKMDLVEKPFRGSLGVDVRDNSNPQYRRNNDPGFGVGHDYSWRGVPNWTLSVPNGSAPFQYAPTHGGFQAMTAMFPSQALFGVCPQMEFNHAGISCHIPNLDRYSGHMHPLGWPNMIESSLLSQFHGWDANNCVVGDNSQVYGNRHLSNSRGLDSGSDTSKDQDGHLKRDSTFPTCKDASVPFQVDGGSTEPASHMSQDDCSWGDVPEKISRTKLSSFESSGEGPMG